MTGIRDIARKAGVSITTVSKVLNNDNSILVREETRTRILKVVKEMNYDINAKKKKPVQSVGIVFTKSKYIEEKDQYYEYLHKGLNEEAYRLHLALNRFVHVSDKPEKWGSLSELGAVIIVGILKEEDLNSILKYNSKVILVDNPDIHEGLDMVYTDLFKATMLALESLYKSNCKDISYIGGYKISFSENGKRILGKKEKRLVSYLEFMKNKQLTQFTNYKLSEDWSEESGELLMQQLIKDRGGSLPEAILVGNDVLALGVYSTLKKMNVGIGKEIKIVSFNDSILAKEQEPTLSSVQLFPNEIGKAAIRLAYEQINNIRNENVYITYPAKLNVRESSR